MTVPMKHLAVIDAGEDINPMCGARWTMDTVSVKAPRHVTCLACLRTYRRRAADIKRVRLHGFKGLWLTWRPSPRGTGTEGGK